jgi:hypothetical protein
MQIMLADALLVLANARLVLMKKPEMQPTTA